MDFLERYSKSPQISKFMKNRPVWTAVLPADRRTDITKLTVALPNFAKACEKKMKGWYLMRWILVVWLRIKDNFWIFENSFPKTSRTFFLAGRLITLKEGISYIFCWWFKFLPSAEFQRRVLKGCSFLLLNVSVSIPMFLKIRYKDYISQTHPINFSC